MKPTYTSYDYLWNRAFLLEGIGTVKCPTLLDIRDMTFQRFTQYINTLVLSQSDMLETAGLTAQYAALSKEEQEYNSKYRILFYNFPDLLMQLIRSFITNDVVELQPQNEAFSIYDYDADAPAHKMPVGKIDNSNFLFFQQQLLLILGIQPPDTKPVVYKNEHARKLAEKIAKGRKAQKAIKTDQNLAFDNRILKYCTHNKTGINILNIGNMTYYQFNKLFDEYNHGRQADYSDMIAANTFSYKDADSYNPMLWIEAISK